MTPLQRKGRLPEWTKLHPVARGALEHAADQIGYGEVGGNNAGPFVAALKRMTLYPGGGTPSLAKRLLKPSINKRFWWPGRNLGAWCASGASWCIEEAIWDRNQSLTNLHQYTPGLLTRAWFNDFEWSWKRHSALKLGEMCAKQYGSVEANELPPVGSLMVKRRGQTGARTGHIALIAARDIETRTFLTIEFNVGAPPAPVKCLVHAVGEEGLLYFARICPA